MSETEASSSLGRDSGFLVHNLIIDKLKSNSDKSFENPFVSPCLWNTDTTGASHINDFTNASEEIPKKVILELIELKEKIF